ncbi:ABC transporter ATP-binding protein [Marinivivus vitaminiproducens]|uniref:ABC transporter ATP-binding protein n=1 Tax=Marinivivus vitaminiproducens TaxID=3035935 RepID=UPI0027A1E82C|nr:ABC transporter ATP-binding protein [Geminicoccaceae bacterium SCSIO 64248]
MSLLDVRDLAVRFATEGGPLDAVRGVSFGVDKGEMLALVGESGSGKSVTALSILQLLPYPPASHPTGSVRLGGQELLGADERTLRAVRGNKVGMIFQEPMTSLNPLHTVSKQIGETLALHSGLTGRAARERILELLRLVRLGDAAERLNAYPHQLSGGQRQRVMIAMALANEPDLLIADEPTTALDVTIQAQILTLIRDLQDRLGMAVLLITHDLTIVRKVANRVAVMTKGELVEQGPVESIFKAPSHPYTRHLLAAEPKGQALKPREDAPVVLSGVDIKVHFPIHKGLLRRTVGHVKAVDGIDLSVRAGQTVGVVGESGSGKTTLGLAMLRLLDSQGRIVFMGKDIQGLNRRRLRPLRRQMQVVFQDPYGSLSPRLPIGTIVAEGLGVHGLAKDRDERRRLVADILTEVGLDPASQDRYPHEFSGGQRQRISIARAMILKPDFVVLDEPTSALDMSVQAQIVELLRDLQAKHNLAYMFISHDLRVVRALSDHILVMQGGKVVEQGPAEAIFERPEHPYTQALMAAALDIQAVETGAVAV